MSQIISLMNDLELPQELIILTVTKINLICAKNGYNFNQSTKTKYNLNGNGDGDN